MNVLMACIIVMRMLYVPTQQVHIHANVMLDSRGMGKHAKVKSFLWDYFFLIPIFDCCLVFSHLVNKFLLLIPHIFVIIDVSECSESTHKCSQFAECIELTGSYDCKCLPGFEGNGHICNGNNSLKLLRYECNIFFSYNLPKEIDRLIMSSVVKMLHISILLTGCKWYSHGSLSHTCLYFIWGWQTMAAWYTLTTMRVRNFSFVQKVWHADMSF